MKTIIKELLDEMIKKPLPDKILLKKAFEELGISYAVTVTEELLAWQKGRVNSSVPSLKYMLADRFLIKRESWQAWFKAFFEHSPAITEIFILGENEVTLNPNLTAAEIKEMQEYIDEHHKISMHFRGLGTIYI